MTTKISLLAGFLLLVLGTITQAQNENTAQTYQRVRIFADQTQLTTLQKLGIDVSHCNMKKGKYLENDFSPYEVEKIKNSGIEYKILFKDANEFYHQRRLEYDLKTGQKDVHCDVSDDKYKVPEDFILGSMNGYFTYVEMRNHLDNMRGTYSSLVSPIVPISDFTTHEGRPIFKTVITGPPLASGDKKEQVLFTSLTHAREPMSMVQNIFFMYYLLENYNSDPMIKFLVDNYEMHFIPCLNPDGYLYNESLYEYDPAFDFHSFGFWRKNKKDNNGDGFFSEQFDGVDLNRNFSNNFGINEVGSSSDPGSAVYRGTSAFSEPETQALKWYFEQHDFKIAFNNHSYSNFLIFPWGYDVVETADHHKFCTLAEVMTKENQYISGLAEDILGYGVNGVSDDWMYSANNTLAFTPEVGHPNEGFYPPKEQIIPLCKLTMKQNLSAIKGLGSYGQIFEFPNKHIEETTGELEFTIKNYGLKAGRFILAATPLSTALQFNNIVTTSDLNIGETETGKLSYTLTDSEFTYNDPIKVVFSLSNESYVEVDTVEFKVRTKMPNNALLEEYDFADAIGWESNSWGLSTTRFRSEPSSVTDSPVGNYNDYENSSLTLTDVIDLTNARTAEVSFWTLWDIEDRGDYVQVIAVNEDSETSLCGLYTNIEGSAGPGEPVYDATQGVWVQEFINLDDFVGQQIELKFELVSDDWVTGDGFYLDDLAVNIIYTDTTARMPIDTIPEEPSDTMIEDTIDNPIDSMTSIAELGVFNNLVVSPNPAKDVVNIQFTSLEDAVLKIYSETGQLMLEQKIKNNADAFSVSIESFNSGIYFVAVEQDDAVVVIQKLVVY